MPDNINLNNQSDSAFVDNDFLYNKKLKTIIPPEKNIGIDTQDAFYKSLILAGESSQLDISKLESFLSVSQSREQIYNILDTMAEDPTISAALEIYVEDVTSTNDQGKIVWCSSENNDISRYVNYLLDTMNVDKNAYRWVYALCKYGDLYLRLYRNSDIEKGLFSEVDQKQTKQLNEKFNNLDKQNDPLLEDVHLIAYGDNDRYTHYIEQVYNPAEMFELTQLGKCYAYVKANINSMAKDNSNQLIPQYIYSFNKRDVEVYDATTFVHACLDDNISRIPEEVQIYTDSSTSHPLKFSVRRGQSLLYNTFKIWREMTLLENSLLLNRITRSSILRIIGIEVGDMDKNDVGPKLSRVKQLIEQKSAINTGTSLNEYTNPGPMENNVYIPTRNGIGSITTQQVGGDVDVRGLGDIDYFKNKLYSSLRIPKQYLGDTDDSTGFNGGTALSIVSSRYAKTIKRIQNTFIQALTDAINLMLLDKGLDSYINRFELHMMPPITQEELDARDAEASRIQIAQDIMNLLDVLQDEKSKLEILKNLLAPIINNNNIIGIIQDYIEKQEEVDTPGNDQNNEDDIDINIDNNIERPTRGAADTVSINIPETSYQETSDQSAQMDNDLPNPASLDMDFTDNNEF